MSKPTASAAGGAMPAEGHKTRRATLGFLARSTARVSALACLPAIAMAASPMGDDAELLAMEAEIMRLRGLAKAICAEKVDPFEDEFIALMKGDGSEAAWAFARSYGRDDAIDEAETFHLPADRLCERLMRLQRSRKPGERPRRVCCWWISWATSGAGRPTISTGTSVKCAPSWASSPA